MGRSRRRASLVSTSSAPSSSRPCCVLWRGDVIKRMWWVLMLAAAVPLAAQDPTGGGAEPQDTVEAAQLRQQIEQRFHEIVRQRLALTDDQDAKLRATQEKHRTQRQPLFQ